MSRSSETVVDSRVVELTLNNREFESNAARSISTISKLKDSLDFSDAGKGLDEISKSAKNINLDKLNSGLEAASRGFSAMEAVAFGAFARIGAKISDTAIKVGKMFTVDPIHDGFKEYGLKMDSVQTIMASTGESLEAVNGYLEELNLYADKTIYSFSDMTNSIGKFTNAGVSLKDAVAAIQGISNEAAVSGANSEQASRAMYNFAQALSSGFVKLIDWKSIENANMATVEFKDQLLQTAVELGTVRKEADGTYKVLTHGNGSKGMQETISATKNFNDSLQHQWMTTEVLTKTLAKYSDETTEIGKKAFQAATEVKTFGQLVDTLKEAAGSGWAQTWEILIGDFNQAKELFTFLSDRIGGLIDGFSRSRNDFLKAAMGAPTKYVTAEDWENLDLSASKAKSLSAALIEVGKASGIKFADESVDGLVASLSQGWLTADKLKEALNMGTADFGQTEEELEKVRDAARRVIRGDYGNDMAKRFQLLEEEGFNPQQVQDYVNALHKAAGGTWNLTEEVYKEADAVVFTTEALAAKSDEELKAMGWSEKRIKNLRKLQKQAEETGTPLNQLIADLDKPQKSGRDNLFGSIRDIFDTIKSVTFQVQRAWASIFPKADADKFRNMTAGLKDLTQKIKMFAVNKAQKIFQVFRGLFSVLDIGIRIVKTIGGVILNVLGKALGALLPPIGNALVYISNLLSKFRDWIVENQIIEGAMNALGNAFDFIGSKVKVVFDKIGSIFEFGGKVVGLFMTRLEHLGGFSFENVIKSFNFVKRVVFDYLNKKFPAFAKFRETIKNTFGAIGGVFKNVGSSVSGFFKSLMQNEAVKNGITKIKTKFTGAFGKIAKAVKIGQVASGMFMKKIKELGGFSFKNVVIAFNDVKDRVFNYLDKKHPGFKKFREQFSELGTKIKDTLANIGLDSEGIKSKWKAFSGFAVDTFWKVYDGAKDIGGKIVTKVKDFLANPIVQENINKFKSGFSRLWDSLGPFFGGFGDVFNDFLGRVKELGGFSFDNLGAIWEAFKGTIGEHFKNFTGFDGIKTAFSALWDDIVKYLEDHGIGVEQIQEKIKAFSKTVAGFFGTDFDIPKMFSNFINLFVEDGEDASKTIDKQAPSIAKSIAGFTKTVADELTTNGIKLPSATSTLFGFLAETLETIHDAEEKAENLDEETNPVTRFIINFIGEIKKIVSEIPVYNLMAFAGFITTLKSLWDVSSAIKDFGKAAKIGAKAIKQDENESALETIGGILENLFKFVGVLALQANFGNAEKFNETLTAVAAVITAIGIVIGGLSVVLKRWGTLPTIGGGPDLEGGWLFLENLFGNLINKGFIALLIPLASGALAELSQLPDDADKIKGVAEALGLFIVEIVGIAEVIAGLGKLGIDAVAAAKGTAAVGVVLALSVGVGGIFSKLNEAVDDIKGLEKGSTTKQVVEDLGEAGNVLAAIGGVLGALVGGIGGGVVSGFGLVASSTYEKMSEMMITAITTITDKLPAIADSLDKFFQVIQPISDGTYKFDAEPFNDVIRILGEMSLIGLVNACGDFLADVLDGENLDGKKMSIIDHATVAMDQVAQAMIDWNQKLGTIDSITLPNGLENLTTELGRITAFGFKDAMLECVSNFAYAVTTSPMQQIKGIMTGNKPMSPVERVTYAMGLISQAAVDWQTKLGEMEKITFPDGFKTLVDNLATASDIGFAVGIEQALLNLGFSFSHNELTGLAEEIETNPVAIFADAMATIRSAIEDWNAIFGSDEDSTIHFDSKGFNDIKKAIDELPDLDLMDIISHLIGANSTAEQFGADMTAVAGGIKAFKDAIPEGEENKIARSVSALRSFADLSNAISQATTIDNLSAFADILTKGAYTGGKGLGEAMTEFFNDVDVDHEDLATLANAAKNLSLAYTTMSVLTLKNSDLSAPEIVGIFADNINKLVDAVSYTASGDYTMVETFLGAVEKIKGVGLAETLNDGGKATSDAISDTSDEASKAASGVGSNAVAAISGELSAFYDVGLQSVGSFSTAFKTEEAGNYLDAAAESLISAATTALNSFKSKFYDTGGDFAEGFANGIANPFKWPVVWKRAWDLGQTALNALRASIASHSPSRESGKLGTYFWQGFAFKMDDGADAVYRSSHGLGQAAVNGLSRSVRAINAMIDSGLNTEPVIRPVLDMTNIQNGSLALNGMNMPVGVAGNLSAINANVNARNVTTNGDILTALNELGSALNRRPSTTNQYTINGITYDDGTNVSSAVRSLIHAARIERRV